MNQVIPMRLGAAAYSAQQMALARRTVAKDANQDEFDQFIHIARHLGLDPLRRQIYCFVFNKDKAEKRQMTVVTGIDGFRVIADRTGNYRPDEDEPEITYDEKLIEADINPKGIVKAKVRVWKFAHGEWHKITGTARWEEFAPIKEVWERGEDGRNAPTGRFKLDEKKDTWRKMPHVMIAKCAEAAALRKGWPDDLSAVYEQSEIDRAHTLDLSASEYAEVGNRERRLELIAGKNAITFDFGEGLENVPIGKVAERVEELIKTAPAHEVMQFENLNRIPLQEFWARNKPDALEVKKMLEGFKKRSEASA